MNLTSFFVGTITKPDIYIKFDDVESGGIGQILTLILNLLVIVGGVYALFNFILAGYSFMSAGGDPQKIQDSWAKIWQSALGLLFIAGSFLLAAIFGQLIFGRWDFILNPTIPTAN